MQLLAESFDLLPQVISTPATELNPDSCFFDLFIEVDGVLVHPGFHVFSNEVRPVDGCCEILEHFTRPILELALVMHHLLQRLAHTFLDVRYPVDGVRFLGLDDAFFDIDHILEKLAAFEEVLLMTLQLIILCQACSNECLDRDSYAVREVVPLLAVDQLLEALEFKVPQVVLFFQSRLSVVHVLILDIPLQLESHLRKNSFLRQLCCCFLLLLS